MNNLSDDWAKDIDFAAYVGIDWADKEHAVCLMNMETGETQRYKVKQDPEALVEWVTGLRTRFGGRKIAVALEQRKGGLIWALMVYDFLVLYPINPKTVAKYREAFFPSGAKGDPCDAELLMDLVRLHRPRMRAWKPEDEPTRLLGLLVEHRRKLVNERTRVTNALQSTLKGYFPQALQLVGEINSIQACDFLTRWPSLKALQGVRRKVIENFYKAHNVRRTDVIERRVREILGARPLTEDPAVIEASVMMVRTKAAQLRCLIEAIDKYEKRIEELFSQHPDRELFESLPGAGEALAPRLATVFGSDRDRYGGADEIQQFSGVAPVTKQSGQMLIVQRRLACPKFVLQTFVEHADQSRKKSGWAQQYYGKQRAQGMSHHAALRALAYKWIRIIYRCWKDRVKYDEEFYQAALLKRQSPPASTEGACTDGASTEGASTEGACTDDASTEGAGLEQGLAA